MTKETMDWLNTMTRIGFTAQRGMAWHWRRGNSNHYENAVPPEEVEALFALATAYESPIYVFDEAGQSFQAPDAKAIVLPKMGNHVAGFFGDGYQIHDYREQLLDKVRDVANGEVGIASAGLLKRGGRAWVQLERPQNSEASGIEFRAGLLAASSLDGSLATIFAETGTFVVCDNTLSWALSGSKSIVRVKHTRNSLEALDKGEVIAALEQMAEDMGHTINRAADTSVSDAQFQQFLDKLIPLPKDDGRGKTLAEKQRSAIVELYEIDPRAAPWRGSVLGVMQAWNTYNNHGAQFRGAAHRAERVTENAINGKIATSDALAFNTIRQLVAA